MYEYVTQKLFRILIILFHCLFIVSNTHSRIRKFPEDYESRRASSRGLIPRAKVKTIKMTFVIVFGND